MCKFRQPNKLDFIYEIESYAFFFMCIYVFKHIVFFLFF